MHLRPTNSVSNIDELNSSLTFPSALELYASDRFLPQTKDVLVPAIIFQTFCCNYPHTDFAFVDFVMTPVILATLKVRISFD